MNMMGSKKQKAIDNDPVEFWCWVGHRRVAKSIRLKVTGTPVSLRNRGVLALGVTPVNLYATAADGAEVILMHGHRDNRGSVSYRWGVPACVRDQLPTFAPGPGKRSPGGGHCRCPALQGPALAPVAGRFRPFGSLDRCLGDG
jgi:hypothetical protein